MTIYDQHRAAFPNVSAYVVMRGKKRVGTVAFKFPRDGAGRLWVYVHWHGVAMVRGYAGGYGYDKQSAAMSNAAPLIELDEGAPNADLQAQKRFIIAIAKDDGYSWEGNLRGAGFTVLQAV